jgi:FtsP/CotA-like multicopper oxidase with cupredoxin domain
MSHLNRRQFLTLSAGSASILMLSQCANPQLFAKPAKQPLSRPSTGSTLFISLNGLLQVELDARYEAIAMGDRRAYLMSYAGQIPGPRLEARPGDTVRIRLTNQLDQPTNLHYHGLHISPTGKADNIFLHIPSGETLAYEFQIPKTHQAGMFYYHPHVHKSVAEQVFGGLGGIFVVRGALDEIPEVKAAQEVFLFLKDFELDAQGRVPVPGHMELMQGREGALITVNGRVNPQITIAKGGLLRLRLLNASASRFYRLALAEHPFYLIATDGGAIAEPVELRELLLAPGERAEVLVRGDRPPGQYRLMNLPYDRGGMMGMMGGRMGRGMMGRGMMHSNQRPQNTPQLLATLAYQGTRAALPLPDKLLSVEALPQPKTLRRIEMSMSMGMGMTGMGMAFLFNGKTFDPNRIDAPVQLGTVEDWELVNSDPDRMDHPFHLHINPFQVISRNGKPEPYRAWKDTVLVRGGETVRIRIPFRDFTGKTVYHCHVLDHEDLGMMGIVDMQA